MAAVSQCWEALMFAGPEAKNDREIMLVALTQDCRALCFAASSLLEDEAFALDDRYSFYLIKVVTLSGASCVVAVDEHWDDEDGFDIDGWCMFGQVIQVAEEQLGLGMDPESAHLLWGTEEVPKSASCRWWPGSPQHGCVCEYQLVIATGQDDS
eukprot:1491737-Amphidinium_carterae.1